MTTRGYTQEDVAHLLLQALRHPPDARLIADVEEAIEEAEQHTDPSERGRCFQGAVKLVDAVTLTHRLQHP